MPVRTNFGFTPPVVAAGVLPTGFSVRNGFEGPQVFVSWNAADTLLVNQIKLVRKFGSYPLTPTDGTLLLAGLNETFFVDETATPGRVFYYTLFVRQISDSQYVFGFSTTGKVLVVDTSDFKDRLFRLLPGVYRLADKETDRVKLVETSKNSGEKVHLGEDGTVGRGQLERFLRMKGIELDRLRSLITAIANQVDVDEADADALPLIAELLGVEFNFDLPILRQREEVKRAVEIYKIKGTEESIIRTAEVITGLDVTLENFIQNIFVSNDPTRKTLDFSTFDPGKKTYPDDPENYTYDFDAEGLYNFETIRVVLTDPSGIGLSRPSLLKLKRQLNLVKPATVELVLVYRAVDVEQYQASDETQTIIEDTDQEFFNAPFEADTIETVNAESYPAPVEVVDLGYGAGGYGEGGYGV